MKNLICFLIIILGLMSCSSNDETKIDNSEIVGKWNWTNTDGGIGYHIHETPSSTGENIILILEKDYSYSIIKNGNEISNGIYVLSMKESIYSQDLEKFISYSSVQEMESLPCILGGRIKVYEANVLDISNNFEDGVGSLYEKIE
jgi:hypothetical protein